METVHVRLLSMPLCTVTELKAVKTLVDQEGFNPVKIKRMDLWPLTSLCILLHFERGSLEHPYYKEWRHGPCDVRYVDQRLQIILPPIPLAILVPEHEQVDDSPMATVVSPPLGHTPEFSRVGIALPGTTGLHHITSWVGTSMTSDSVDAESVSIPLIMQGNRLSGRYRMDANGMPSRSLLQSESVTVPARTIGTLPGRYRMDANGVQYIG